MHGVPARRQSQAGFTLTELLVATAIFVILMSALVTLFSSAIAAVRQGYASIDAFETGRMATTTFSRDLNGAFTAREHGDTYNFYGRPDGFMFVGALANGQIGRVTYVMHPTPGVSTTRTKVREKWGVVEENLKRQARRFAREQMGIAGQLVETQAQNLVDFVAGYYFYSDLSGTRPYLPEEWVEFDVELQTESLIRFEEAGASDLETFNLQVEGNITPPPLTGDDFYLNWPYVDPINPSADATPPANSDGDYLQQFILGAVDPTPGDIQYDLRGMFTSINTNNGWVHPVTGDTLYLRALGRDTFEQLLKARQREFWLRMLSGETMNLPSLAPDLADGSVGYWNDERYNGPNNRRKRVVNEYIIADSIVSFAKLYQPNSDIPVEPAPGIFVDILDAEVKFSYGDGSNEPVNYFNDIQNLRDPDSPDGIWKYNGPLPVPPNPYLDGIKHSVPMLLTNSFDESDLLEADGFLADDALGNRSSRKNLGSPLAPRIPSVVTTDFWVTRTRTRPGAPDILKRFSQTVQIPTAQGRSVSTTIAQGPGASL